MNVDVLTEKVLGAQQKVEKCKATIERHKVQLEKKANQLRALGIDPENTDKYSFVQNGAEMNHDAYWLLCDYDNKKDDIKGAERKLKDAENILQNWTNKRDKAMAQEQKIAENCPPVIREFLEKWKANATVYYQDKFWKWPEFTASLRNAERAARFRCLEIVADVGAAQFVADANLEQELWKRTSIYAPEISKEVRAAKLEKFTEEYTKIWKRYCETKDDYHLNNVFPHQLMDAYLKSCELDHRGLAARRREFGGELLLKMLEQGGESTNAFAYLEKALEAEKKAKILDLISRIEGITGRITDATCLHIGLKGDLEGFVVGEKGKAEINTIGAGGYNVQCFHYRTLIHEFKDKEQSLNSVLSEAYDRSGKTGNGSTSKAELEKEETR